MGLEHRTSMSAEFIVRDMDLFVVILRKAIALFRKHIFSSENILVRTVVDMAYVLPSVNCLEDGAKLCYLLGKGGMFLVALVGLFVCLSVCL